eukprot:12899602-Prorocentrum_lima.AAC.1
MTGFRPRVRSSTSHLSARSLTGDVCVGLCSSKLPTLRSLTLCFDSAVSLKLTDSAVSSRSG